MVAVGPVPMMQAVAQLTADFGIRTTVSLNSLMVDGMGMCGACRVTVGGETRFTCVDGPEFDGHQVDFAELAQSSQRLQRPGKAFPGRLQGTPLPLPRPGRAKTGLRRFNRISDRASGGKP